MTESDYLSQRTPASTQHSMLHLVNDHLMFSPNTDNTLEASMVESRKFLDILKADPALVFYQWFRTIVSSEEGRLEISLGYLFSLSVH